MNKSEILDTKINKKGLVNKSNISKLVKKIIDLNGKLTTLTTKAELNAEQYKIVKLPCWFSKYFCLPTNI